MLNSRRPSLRCGSPWRLVVLFLAAAAASCRERQTRDESSRGPALAEASAPADASALSLREPAPEVDAAVDAASSVAPETFSVDIVQSKCVEYCKNFELSIDADGEARLLTGGGSVDSSGRVTYTRVRLVRDVRGGARRADVRLAVRRLRAVGAAAST